MGIKTLSRQDYFAISRSLERHHALFYAVWNLGYPVFDERIPTAGVAFDEEGEYVKFLFNPKFWDSLNPYERLFIIGHECLHTILNHGVRAKSADPQNRQAANVAMDIVVNHSLVNKFGFNREQLSMGKDLCWIDTVFPDKEVSQDETFEHYYNILPRMEISCSGSAGNPVGQDDQGNDPQKGNGQGKMQTLDDHSIMEDSKWTDLIEQVSESLTDDEKSDIKDFVEKNFQDGSDNSNSKQAGTEAGNSWVFANVGKVKPKKKWETVIKKWSKKYDKPEFQDVEQWARTNRRFTNLSSNLLLPTEVEVEKEAQGKIEVWFMQDTSGSCSGYIDRFFSAALSLPKERFNVRMYCFDTSVYETSLESRKLYGFGGTYFHILEDYIQNKIKHEKVPYPKAVFCITDGYGSDIQPQFPEYWYWFLTPGGSTRNIPKECNIFDLKDFE